jgi:translation initiation factor 1 (eIF-1/SUI1)
MNLDDEFEEFTAQELIHIHKVNTRGRKYETRVLGIPEIFDHKKILKFWKNVSHF